MKFPSNNRRDSNKFTQAIRLMSLMICNLQKRQISTRRDLYYQDVQLFQNQSNVDKLVEMFVKAMDITGDEIGAVASQKGLVLGDVRYQLPDGSFQDCYYDRVPALIPRFTHGTIVTLLKPVDYLLIVEKEAIMSALTNSNEKRLLISGKGFADVLTRSFVHQLMINHPEVPIFGIADFDPHGFMILQNYKKGSGKLLESCPRLQLTSGSICDFVHGSSILDMTNADLKKCANALSNWTDLQENWRRELQRMMFFGKKAELDVMKDSSGEVVGYIDKMCQRALTKYKKKQRANAGC
jgi:meiotic recombination protein SPO11